MSAPSCAKAVDVKTAHRRDKRHILVSVKNRVLIVIVNFGRGVYLSF